MKLLPHNKRHLFETAAALLGALLWNEVVYYGGRLVAQSLYHYDMTLSIDAWFPFLPWTVAIYFGCYLFWGVYYYIIALQKTAVRDRFFTADILSKTICLVFFIVLPTTNVRPALEGHQGVWASLMQLLYTIDSADNLFPSIHCLVSWQCWVGVRKQKHLPARLRYFALVAAVAVCLSTLTTRQHVLADVISGILLAELCYALVRSPKVHGLYGKGLSRLAGLFCKI